MSDDAARTLLHPFRTGGLPAPGTGVRALFVGARPGFELPEDFAAGLTLVQGFRPDFLALERQGHAVRPEPEGDGYDLALVLAGRHRAETDARIADALRRLAPGGMLVAAAAKEDGGDSLRKRWTALLPEAEHLSKHHGVVFWGKRPVTLPEDAAQETTTVDGRFTTASGMFSHGEVDAASRMLADALPADIKGAVADFGAGWGYLAARVAERLDRVSTLHLYEADFASCAAARANLAPIAGSRAVEIVWADVTAEKPLQRYDAIVMNPPFHGLGRKADPAIGAAMIAAASAALKPGGRLFMVANRQLPYEAALKKGFGAVEELPGDGRFKLFAARR